MTFKILANFNKTSHLVKTLSSGCAHLEVIINILGRHVKLCLPFCLAMDPHHLCATLPRAVPIPECLSNISEMSGVHSDEEEG